MSESTLSLLIKASRPFRSFTIDLDGEEKILKTRRPSAAQMAELRRSYSEDFDRFYEEMLGNKSDMAVLRRNFTKQPKEKLVEMILAANMQDALSEASSQLDDLPLSDKRVVARAEELIAAEKVLMMGASQAEIVDKAIDQRIYVLASLRATETQTQYVLLYTIYDEDEKPLFNSIEDIKELSPDFGAMLLTKASGVSLEVTKDSPLPLAKSKSSRGRSQSPKPSAEE